METVRYAIHGMIDVLVGSRVNDSVIEQIDLEIGYFKTARDQPSAPQLMYFLILLLAERHQVRETFQLVRHLFLKREPAGITQDG